MFDLHAGHAWISESRHTCNPLEVRDNTSRLKYDQLRLPVSVFGYLYVQGKFSTCQQDYNAMISLLFHLLLNLFLMLRWTYVAYVFKRSDSM